MKITALEIHPVSLRLKEPFKIALESVAAAENVYVKVLTDEGIAGWGEAAPFKMVTGETQESIVTALRHLEEAVRGLDPLRPGLVCERMDQKLVNNHGAKAAVVNAVYDIISQAFGAPLYRMLGGYRDEVRTDITCSIKNAPEMAEDARRAVKAGFTVLKIKVGLGLEEDVQRVAKIREAVGPGVKLRLDANQGWTAREAVRALRALEGFEVEFVEQPVPAGDLDGLAEVRRSVSIPVMADESVFSPADALRVIKRGAVDFINIKLMKSGGIYRALQINALAEAAGIECMLGQMVESRLGTTTAAHLAAACRNITRVDLDMPLFLAEDPTSGGVSYHGERMALPSAPGLGAVPDLARSPALAG